MKPHRKYWNCFGIEDCSAGNAALAPDLEINPPPAGGMNLNYSGVFLTTRSGEDVYLGHTGRITIHHRKKKQTREQFITEYESLHPRLPVVVAFRKNKRDYVKVVLIGRISEPNFKDRLFGFVKDVRTIKNQYKPDNNRRHMGTQ